MPGEPVEGRNGSVRARVRRAIVRYYAALRLSIGIVVAMPAYRPEALPVPALVRRRSAQEAAVLAQVSSNHERWARWRRYKPGCADSEGLISLN